MSVRASAYQTGSKDGAVVGRFAMSRAYVGAHYGRVLFIAVFLVPTLLAAIFWGAVASDRYVSESRFIVRGVNKSSLDGSSAALQEFGITRTNDDAYAIQDYIASRDFMHLLMRKMDLRAIYDRPGADPLTSYRKSHDADTDEAFYRYFIRQTRITYDMQTGITDVAVSAYRPQDAKAIADAVIQLSEARVNELNIRSRRDAVSYARRALDDAANALIANNVELTRYRNSERIVDPQEAAGQTEGRASELDQELAQLRVQLQGMLERAPSGPAIPAVRRRIAALEVQVAAQKGELTGGEGALSDKLGGYEQLVVKRDLAEKLYEAAQKRLDTANEDASRQQIYIETVARPNLADEPEEPRRWRYFFTVALMSLWAFMIFYLLFSGAREHLNVH